MLSTRGIGSTSVSNPLCSDIQEISNSTVLPPPEAYKLHLRSSQLFIHILEETLSFSASQASLIRTASIPNLVCAKTQMRFASPTVLRSMSESGSGASSAHVRTVSWTNHRSVIPRARTARDSQPIICFGLGCLRHVGSAAG